MHPTLHRAPFTRPGWLIEHKLDGFRALAWTGAKPALVSRNGLSYAAAFPEVMAALRRLSVAAVLECELVVVDGEGRPQWERLRRHAVMRRPGAPREAAAAEPSTLCAFDVLAIDGEDLRAASSLNARNDSRNSSAAHRPFTTSTISRRTVRRYSPGCASSTLRASSPKGGRFHLRAGRRAEWLKVKNPSYSRQEALRFTGQWG